VPASRGFQNTGCRRTKDPPDSQFFRTFPSSLVDVETFIAFEGELTASTTSTFLENCNCLPAGHLDSSVVTMSVPLKRLSANSLIDLDKGYFPEMSEMTTSTGSSLLLAILISSVL